MIIINDAHLSINKFIYESFNFKSQFVNVKTGLVALIR